MLTDLLLRLRALLRRDSVERELDEELQFHLEQQVETNVRSGLTLQEARRRARMAFGGLDQVKEECREARGVWLLEAAIQDLRYGIRGMGRRLGFTAVAVVTLALGIGVSTAVFSLVWPVLLRPIPVPELNRLVVAWETDPSETGSVVEVSFPYFLDWRAQSGSFEDLAAFGSVNWSYELKGSPRRETVPAAFVSASFFDTLRARALLGRTFLPREDEPASPRIVVLSYALWQRRFSGSPAVVGTSVTGGDQPFTIVGVMPKEFDFPRGAELWAPVGPELDAVRRRESMTPDAFKGLGVLYVVGRLKNGVSLETARTELAGISHRLSLADGLSGVGLGARLVPLVEHYLGRSTRQALEALAVASGFVLLLACANVAVLLLVQAIGRRTDLAVRRALGASDARVALHQIAESVLLAGAGGVAGTLLAKWAVQAVVALGPTEMPGLQDVSLDGRALGFALVITVVAGVLVGLAPVWLASRFTIAPILNSGRGGVGPDRRGWHLSRLLVTAEVALSIVLLVGCGLMVRSLGKLLQVGLGFVPGHTLSFSVDLAREKYPTGVERRAFYRGLIERLAVLPGVEAVGAVYNRPLEYGPIGMDDFIVVEGQPLDTASVMANSVKVNWEAATPDYFRAVGTRLVEGRTFTEHDTEDAPKVVIVSQSLARRSWPGETPLGKRLHTADAKWELNKGTFINVEWQTVVGVVEDARYRGIQDPRFDVYLPYGQAPAALHHFVVRTSDDPLMLAGAVREQVRAIDGDAAVGDVTTLSRLVERALTPWRFSSALLTGFGLAALVLTASGLFAVMHHFVSGRAREIAIRMAVGAEPRRVRAFVLRQGLGVTARGLALGLVLSLVLTRSLSALLYGVGEGDPWTYLGGAALIGLVATVACLLPARRAARVDPAAAMRSE
jgi:putative ABC transport system permease protein